MHSCPGNPTLESQLIQINLIMLNQKQSTQNNGAQKMFYSLEPINMLLYKAKGILQV